MIYVDDSGWGSLLGGVMIGIYDGYSFKFHKGLIPIKYFQGSTFRTGAYRHIALNIFRNALTKIKDKTWVTVCRGTCLDEIWNFVKTSTAGVQIIDRQEIKDPLQSMLENSFAKSLQRYGVPQKTDGAHCLSFDDQLKWIREDPKRVKYVKTGWRSWKNKYSVSK